MNISTSEQLFFLKSKGSALYNLGNFYRIVGTTDSALFFVNKAIEVWSFLDNRKELARSYNSIGVIFYSQGNYARAIDYYTRSLEIGEEIGDENRIAGACNNIGIIYYEQEEYALAREYYSRSLKICEEAGNETGRSLLELNIGSAYSEEGDDVLALDYFLRSLKLSEEIGNEKNAATCLNNISLIYLKQGDYEKAFKSNERSLELRKEINDQRGIAQSYINAGTIYESTKNASLAKKNFINALTISEEIGAKIESQEAAKSLWHIYKLSGKYDLALKMHELFISMGDSIRSQNNQKEIIRQEFRYKYEKQITADSIKSAEESKLKDALISAERAKNKQAEQQTYFLYGGMLLTLLFGGLIFNRFRITSKQKKVIELQKERVDEAFNILDCKNQEILDSINYAKRIQKAILPSKTLFREFLPNSFVLYKPKDIVAGDFYWLNHQNGVVMFAVADCTGHGVPGAMISVVCNNGLNRSVKEYGLTNPGEILNKTREIVISEFEKSEDDVKDGMDIAFCALKENKLCYAGANNPLWIIRKGLNEVEEIKANKQPIGKYEDEKSFDTHEIELNKGDTIYIFSDGYADQFGGIKGKKFKTKALKSLLIDIHGKPMGEQKNILETSFEKWKGDIEQVDDVCVAGFRF